jgi:hypothetical protein
MRPSGREPVTRDDPPVFLWYPKYVGVHVAGDRQLDPTYSAVSGVKLADALRARDIEVVLSYSAKPNTQYGSMQAFMISKLKGVPRSR